MAHTIPVKLSKFENQPWGFRLQGGKDFAAPLTIQKVNVGSLAEKAGLRAGDAIIRINDVDVFNLRHKEAQDAIVRAGNNFEIVVSRGGAWKPATMETKQSNGEPPLVKVSPAAPSKQCSPCRNVFSSFNSSPRPFVTSQCHSVKAGVDLNSNNDCPNRNNYSSKVEIQVSAPVVSLSNLNLGAASPATDKTKTCNQQAARPVGSIGQQPKSVSPSTPLKAGKPAGDIKLINKQFNSPMGLYSEESIAETLSAQAEVLAQGVLGVNFKKNEKTYNAANSEVYKMLLEMDRQPKEPEPGKDIDPADALPHQKGLHSRNLQSNAFRRLQHHVGDEPSAGNAVHSGIHFPTEVAKPVSPVPPAAPAAPLKKPAQPAAAFSPAVSGGMNPPPAGGVRIFPPGPAPASALQAPKAPAAVHTKVTAPAPAPVSAPVTKPVSFNPVSNRPGAEGVRLVWPPPKTEDNEPTTPTATPIYIAPPTGRFDAAQSNDAAAFNEELVAAAQPPLPGPSTTLAPIPVTTPSPVLENESCAAATNIKLETLVSSGLAATTETPFDPTNPGIAGFGSVPAPAPIPAPAPVLAPSALGSGTSAGVHSSPRRGRGILKPQTGPGVRVPVCASCNMQIRGPFVTAIGRTWCPDHFVCGMPQCRRPLQDIGFVEEKNNLHCEACFENYLAPNCARCQKRVKGDCLNAIGKQFHPECFACAYCGRLFGNNHFYLEDGLPYCEADWNELFTTKCHACGFPIEAGDRWVEAMNSNYHSQCFNCSICKKNLEGQSFLAKGGRPMCKSHAH